MDGVAIEVGDGRSAALIDERETAAECLDGSREAVTSGAAHLDEVVRRGNGDEQPAFIANDPPELGCIHTGRDRKNARERPVGVRQKTVCVADDPLARRVAARRSVNRRDRDIDAVSRAFAGECK